MTEQSASSYNKLWIGIGEKFAGRDCPGGDALRFRAGLEWPGQGGGTVPAGHQQDDKGNAGGPAFDTAGHHHSGERLYARQSPAQPSTGPLRTATLRQTPGGPGPRRDLAGRVDPHGVHGRGGTSEEGRQRSRNGKVAGGSEGG